MDQTIPTDDLDSLVTEDFSSTSDSSESEQDMLQSAIESMSGGIGSSLKSPPNQRNFASLLGNAQKSPERNFASLLGKPQKSPERNFASLLEPKGSNQRSFATILGRQKSPNRNFSSLLPSRDSNSKFTLVLKSKVKSFREKNQSSICIIATITGWTRFSYEKDHLDSEDRNPCGPKNQWIRYVNAGRQFLSV